MTPNKDLSDAMFVHYSTEGHGIQFDRVSTPNHLSPVVVEGKQLEVELNQETTAISREKYGDHYIEFEVARILLVHGLFHLHKDILIESAFTGMIFETRIALYVRP